MATKINWYEGMKPTTISIRRGSNKWIWGDNIKVSTPTDHIINVNDKDYFLSDDAIEEYLTITAYYVGALVGLLYTADPIECPDDLDLLASVAMNWSIGDREMVIKKGGGRYYEYKTKQS
jgi:hypothetical protein